MIVTGDLHGKSMDASDFARNGDLTEKSPEVGKEMQFHRQNVDLTRKNADLPGKNRDLIRKNVDST